MWSEERIAQVAKLWDEGLSATQIAVAMGCGLTRNAVLGKLNRIGRLSDGYRQPGKKLGQKNNQPKPIAMPRVKNPYGARPLMIKPAKNKDRFLPVVVNFIPPNPVSLEELEPAQCKWPLWDKLDDPVERFCAEVVLDGSSYCATHKQLACARSHKAIVKKPKEFVSKYAGYF